MICTEYELNELKERMNALVTAVVELEAREALDQHAELNRALHDRDEARIYLKDATKSRLQAIAERDRLKAEVDELKYALDERDAAQIERDRAVREIDQMRESFHSRAAHIERLSTAMGDIDKIVQAAK